jgi:hypothetical protein
MANISFGLDADEYASESGFDKFKIGQIEQLTELGKDAWKYNPVSSIIRLEELEQSKNVNEPLVDRQKLNKEYGKYNLFFEEDEKQSTVDILVRRKKQEIERQSIIQRGPEGELSNLYLPSIAKFGTSMVASLADPINLAMMFVPVVGEIKFASMIAKYGFNKARFAKGAIEGAVGIAAVEPLVYYAATEEQSDYGLVDSIMAVTFGTVLGGGLHVGIGKLKDFNTHRKFKNKIKEAREKSGITDGEDPAFSLYKEYYPEGSRIMKELAETDPGTRRALLIKALSDLGEEAEVNVKDIADLDPKLRNAQLNEKVPENERVNIKNQIDENIQNKKQENTLEGSRNRVNNSIEQKSLDEYELDANKKDIELRNLDEEANTVEVQLNTLKNKQSYLKIADDQDLVKANKESEEFNTKQKEIKDAIIEGINCTNGK